MKRALNYTLFFLVLVVLAIVYAAPDWIVDPPVKSASALESTKIVEPAINPLDTNKPTEVATAPNTPQIQISDNKPAAPTQPKTHTIPASIGYGGTPLPAVEAVDGADYVRADGYQNMCYQMSDGTWTTVIYQGAGGPGMYPYKGDIDVSTGAPATAANSQQWCADHASV